MGPDIPQDTKGGITMTLKEAITLFGYHQRSNVRARTVRSYQPLLQRFEVQFGERSFDSIGSDEIFQFFEAFTGNHSRSTRRLRYAQLKALFNFLIDKCNLNMKNPCDTPLLSKAFKTPKQVARRNSGQGDRRRTDLQYPDTPWQVDLRASGPLRTKNRRSVEDQSFGCCGSEAGPE